MNHSTLMVLIFSRRVEKMSWLYFQDQWELNHKVNFDGINRQIVVTPGETNISVKEDIYSAWKEWIQLYSNAKFPPALRVIGGDPTGQGLFAGDIYFLTNDWQVVVNHRVFVSGVLYSDNQSIDPYLVQAGGGVISTVSNLVQTAETQIPVAADQVSPSEIAQAVWADVDALKPAEISDEVWNNVKALTVAKFIGLS